MSSLSSVLSRAGCALTRSLRQLCGGLDSLRDQLRAAIATTVSKTVAEAVSDAVEFALTERDQQPHRTFTRPTSRSYGQSGHLFAEERGVSWSAREERNYHDRDDWRRDPYERERDLSDEEPEPSPEAPQEERWRQSVSLGLRAANWWLAHHSGPFSLVMSLGVGVATGLVHLLSGALGSGLGAVLDAGLRVLGLADTVCAGAQALAGDGS